MNRVLLTLVVMFCAASLSAQGINNVRINEVLVLNEDNYEDDYGHRSAWIEFFNSGYERVNLSSCYIGVTHSDGSETRYHIPKDKELEMHSQAYLVFFCEGTGTKGTFYTNFTLEDVVKITLYNSNNKDVIDEFAIDRASQVADVSVGWMSPDGIAEPQIMSLPQTTPKATNETVETISKDELFHQRDRSGVMMAIIAMSVVFIALVLIFLVLKLFGMVMVKLDERKTAKPVEAASTPKRKPAGEQVQEELAAAALALKLYQEELHIRESTVITINRASRVYSPWSSKIHGIPAIPTKK